MIEAHLLHLMRVLDNELTILHNHQGRSLIYWLEARQHLDELELHLALLGQLNPKHVPTIEQLLGTVESLRILYDAAEQHDVALQLN